MNQKEQQAHGTKLEQPEASVTEAIMAIEEHLSKTQREQHVANVGMGQRQDEQGRVLKEIVEAEQQGRDLFAKMIDDETQYRKAQVRMLEKTILKEAQKSEAALYNFVACLPFWRRLRWVFFGCPFAIPAQVRRDADERMQPIKDEIAANRKVYYGEKPR